MAQIVRQGNSLYDKYGKDFEVEEQKEQQAILDKIAELKKRKNVDSQQMLIEVAMMQQDLGLKETVGPARRQDRGHGRRHQRQDDHNLGRDR